MVKTSPNFFEENYYWQNNIFHVLGLDEVGRGAFAGPIVAAGVIFKPNFSADFLSKINDSKLIKSNLREELSVLIKENSLWSIQSVELDFINIYGIGKANIEVFKKVVADLKSKIDDNKHFILADGFNFDIPNSKAITKGDQKSLSIASASIIAKVFRDNLMREAGKTYERYGFDKNMGYGTLFHREAIKKHGLCEMHRKSFDLSKFQ